MGIRLSLLKRLILLTKGPLSTKSWLEMGNFYIVSEYNKIVFPY